MKKETSEINLKSLHRDQQPPLARSHLSSKSLATFYLTEVSFLVSPGDYSEAPCSDSAPKVSAKICQVTSTWQKCRFTLRPPQFQSGPQICKVPLYPRGGLKVYHLLSSYSLWTNYCAGLSAGEAKIDSVCSYDV